MSSEKKDYPSVGAPSAPAYFSVQPGGPYPPAYPPPAYTTTAQAHYMTNAPPTYLPASYPIQHHLPYGAVSVTPNLAYGVQPAYLAQVYQPRPNAAAAVYVPATYDAGARFDGHAVPVVPPPPPGVAPNAAQIAMMQGSPVVLSQQKGSYLSGGAGAGFTFW